MNTIEIKTDLSGEELQVLIWEIEAFCEGRRLPKPVLRQTDVSGQLKAFAKHWNETRADFVTIDDCDIEDFLSL